MNGDLLPHSDEYISPEDEDTYVNDLKIEDYNLYLEYKGFKIVHFIQVHCFS